MNRLLARISRISLGIVVFMSSAVADTDSVMTQSFVFTASNGEISARVEEVEGSEKKFVSLSPFVAKTDADLYHASLESLWYIYGKARGLFQLDKARFEPDRDLGKNAICWPVENPKQKFCVLPTKDESGGKIAAITVWLK